MECPICRIARLVTIRMTVNEKRLALHSCSHCETKWWDCDGANVGLKHVLQTAAVRRSA